MKKEYFLLAFAMATALLVACNNYPTRLDPPGSYGMSGGAPASLFANQKGNVSCQVSDGSCLGQTVGAKTGEACSSIFLFGVIGTGDMSIATAARNGKITKIGTVDYSQLNVLGSLYFEKCTIVSGD
ncbi:hypothetical protein LPTSP3_g06680 [Leptospira kobayashii]|uniref:TRL-like family protein n=1 Tax=Leptospira kobayashii TaxID=1917830 RepID=A0ABM7URF0_9LEPT|nr:TRL domain-containing protein [Leptospira kobayashii]BDA77738.1 hypothetical protein LPTSP3_g06680 [Leptospira kobayashii]